MSDVLLWTVAAILAADFLLSDELDDRLLVVAIPSLIERNDTPPPWIRNCRLNLTGISLKIPE